MFFSLSLALSSLSCFFSYSFAYVDFETPEAKKVAIALSEQPLLGRKLLIKNGELWDDI